MPSLYSLACCCPKNIFKSKFRNRLSRSCFQDSSMNNTWVIPVINDTYLTLCNHNTCKDVKLWLTRADDCTMFMFICHDCTMCDCHECTILQYYHKWNIWPLWWYHLWLPWLHHIIILPWVHDLIAKNTPCDCHDCTMWPLWLYRRFYHMKICS
jgi:hypothetical protein